MECTKVGYYKQRNGQPAYLVQVKETTVHGSLWGEHGWSKTSWTKFGAYSTALGQHSRDLVAPWDEAKDGGIPAVEDQRDREALGIQKLIDADHGRPRFPDESQGVCDVPPRVQFLSQHVLDDLPGWRLHRPHQLHEVRFVELVKCVNVENHTGNRFVETFSGHSYSAEMLAQLGMWASVPGRWDKPSPGYSHPTRCRRLYETLPAESRRSEAEKTEQFMKAFSRPPETPRTATMVLADALEMISDVAKKTPNEVQVVSAAYKATTEGFAAVEISLTTGQRFHVIVKAADGEDPLA